MRGWKLLGTVAALVVTAPAAAQLRPLVAAPATVEAARAGVDVYLVNEGRDPLPAVGPAELWTVSLDGTKMRLIPAADEPQTVAPGGFARLRYRLATSFPLAVSAPSPATPPAVAAKAETTLSTSAGAAAAFLDRFHPYEPIYGVAGTGRAGAKLQFSLDFRLLGHDDRPHLDFAYTQTMFWAIDRPSAPFRATTYSPEVFLDLPVDAATTIGLGYRHDSNGGGPIDSADANRLFVRASERFGLGGDWQLSVAPMAWVFVGNHGNAPTLPHYWGNTGLAASLGQADGIKLAVSGKLNFGSGLGGAEAFLSYPLARIDHRLPHLYVFGQAFTGYGEAIGGYDRHTTNARIGIALTR